MAVAYWSPDPARQVSGLAVAPAWWPHPPGSDIFIFPLSPQLGPAVGGLWFASLSTVRLLSNSIARETNSLPRNPALDPQVQLSSFSVGHWRAQRDLCSVLKRDEHFLWPSFCFPLLTKWRREISWRGSAEGHTVPHMCGSLSLLLLLLFFIKQTVKRAFIIKGLFK